MYLQKKKLVWILKWMEFVKAFKFYAEVAETC
jgi:hypothetical protein